VVEPPTEQQHVQETVLPSSGHFVTGPPDRIYARKKMRCKTGIGWSVSSANMEREMAKKAKKRAVRRPWTKEDERELRSHSKSKSPIRAVVKGMKRTAGALRQKAFSLGLSLGHRRSAKKRRA
jgi:hypothetical protein